MSHDSNKTASDNSGVIQDVPKAEASFGYKPE